jgi:glucose-6-phosphate 1-dehydrogenase
MTAREAEVAEANQADAYYCEIPNDPCVIVMFGASGDLARRKLLPALYDLARHSCLAPRFRLVGFARTKLSDDDFRRNASEFLPKADSPGPPGVGQQEFLKHLQYFSGNYDDPEAYRRLTQRLEDLDRDGQLGGNRLYYLATPPDVYPHVIEQLGKARLAHPKTEKSWTRVIIEKPFGHDQASARALNDRVLSVFEESQVYRIDHYLGKETVQNMLVLRFGNGIFEPLWNRNYVDHVQITAAESLGVERRAAFYESTGALRDMIQSHVLQLTSLVAMEAPATFDATSVRNEKIKVLQSIRPFTQETIWKSVVRGQYGPGMVYGKAVPGYRQEPGVKPDSATTEVAIRFKQAPHMVFRSTNAESNSLILNIQPDEGISLSFGAKAPGSQMQIRPVTMDFQYREAFGGGSRDAYATLINDCIRGDATLFDRADSVEAAWALVDPILEAWRTASPPPFPNYPAGSEGPRAADDLTASDGRHWRAL